MTELDVESKIARVSNILEQIEELNKLIEFQEKQQADASTIRQHEFMRQQFVAELETLLREFKLSFPSLDIAA